MSIAEKTLLLKNDFDDVYDAGKHASDEEFEAELDKIIALQESFLKEVETELSSI